MLSAAMVTMDCITKVKKMADVIDDANDQVEKNERRSIEYAMLQAKKEIPKSEVCLWCLEGTSNGARWCCADCRDAWEQNN